MNYLVKAEIVFDQGKEATRKGKTVVTTEFIVDNNDESFIYKQISRIGMCMQIGFSDIRTKYKDTDYKDIAIPGDKLDNGCSYGILSVTSI
jgi:hypothetical protein